jgi:hypothetical protein
VESRFKYTTLRYVTSGTPVVLGRYYCSKLSEGQKVNVQEVKARAVENTAHKSSQTYICVVQQIIVCGVVVDHEKLGAV